MKSNVKVEDFDNLCKYDMAVTNKQLLLNMESKATGVTWHVIIKELDFVDDRFIVDAILDESMEKKYKDFLPQVHQEISECMLHNVIQIAEEQTKDEEE